MVEEGLVRASHVPWAHLGHSTTTASVFHKTTSAPSSCTIRAGPWGTLILNSIATSACATSSATALPRTTRRLGGSTRWGSAQGNADATKYLNRLDENTRTECPLLGKQVVVTGTSRQDLNGRAGAATSFDHSRGRYVVDLRGDVALAAATQQIRKRKGNQGGKGTSRHAGARGKQTL